MTPTDTPSDDDLARLLRDECTQAERRQIESWLSRDPAHAGRLDDIARLMTPPETRSAWDVDAMWSEVRQSSIEPGATQRPRPLATPSVARFGSNMRRGRGTAWRTGLLVAGLAGLAALALRNKREVPTAVLPTIGFREYVTRRGEQVLITLGDGSRVSIAPESRLRIPDDYGTTHRRVELVGEAIFHVEHDSSQVFQVQSGPALIEDIGTRFDVRAYPEDERVLVAVEEGEVSLADTAHASQARRILHGSLGTLAGGDVHVRNDPRLGRYFAWADGHLVFDNEPVAAVLQAISRWYDVDVRIADASLGKRRVTATFTTQRPEEMMHSLAEALNARVVRDGRIATLTTASP